MPRKKISIEEAFKVLEEAGIPVQVKQQVVSVTAEQPIVKRKRDPSIPYGVVQKVNPRTIKVVLFAKHSVGAGGVLVNEMDGSKHVESAGVESYGPGICVVPRELVAHLLHQDELAKQADENMLSKERKSFIVVERRNSDGNIANAGVRVSDDFFEQGLGNLPTGYMHYIRG